MLWATFRHFPSSFSLIFPNYVIGQHFLLEQRVPQCLTSAPQTLRIWPLPASSALSSLSYSGTFQVQPYHSSKSQVGAHLGAFSQAVLSLEILPQLPTVHLVDPYSPSFAGVSPSKSGPLHHVPPWNQISSFAECVTTYITRSVFIYCPSLPLDYKLHKVRDKVTFLLEPQCLPVIVPDT